MIKYTNVLLGLIFSTLGNGCITISDDVNQPRAIAGTIESNFEIFSFEPDEKSEESFWINSKSANAENWSLYSEAVKNSDVYNNERAEGFIVPFICIYVQGRAVTKSYEDGIGHLGAWKSDITFTEITSAKTGKCKY